MKELTNEIQKHCSGRTKENPWYNDNKDKEMENVKDWSTVSKAAEESTKIQPKVFLVLTAPVDNNT